MKIRDRVFVVTGGGNGVGREVVLALLGKGARVAAVDISEPALLRTAGLAAAGDRLSTHTVSITDREAVLDLPHEVAATHGCVDGLINVAGVIHEFKPVAELDFEDLERVVGVNFWGTVNTTKAFLPMLQERREASLVNVASLGALVPFPRQSVYGASKAAVKLFTEGLIAEHQGVGLKVSIVFPGGVDTGIALHSGVELPEMDAAAAQKAQAALTSPQDAAMQIVGAVGSGRPRVTIGKDARMMDLLGRIMPSRVIGLIAKKMQSLAS